MSKFPLYRVNNDEQIPVMVGTKDEEPGHLLENIANNITINVISMSEEEIIFDLIGVDVSIANALRRILIAEVMKYLFSKFAS